MKLERKQPLKKLETRTLDVLEAIDSLSWMPKYPEKPEHLKFIAERIAEFCDTGEVLFTSIDPDDPDPQVEEGWGWTKPLDWLVKQVGSTCSFFPAPIKWRQIYIDGTPFSPLDGRSANSLLAVIDG